MESIKKRLQIIPYTKQIISKKLSREEEARLSKIKEDYKMEFKDFTKMVLEFQIKLRDKYLSHLVFIFKKIDIDNNGLIEEEDFFKLIYGLGYYGEDSENQALRLLNISDPYNNKQLTFSECVNLFGSEIIIDQDEKGSEIQTSLLDKISVDSNVILNFN